MIIDTSADIAILRSEPKAGECAAVIGDASAVRMSAANFLEAAIPVDGTRDPIASRRFDDFIREASIAIHAVDEAQVRLAWEAYRDFGRGSGHPARLNYGDCFAYALARSSGEPLLFVGDDFAQTDIQPAIQPPTRNGSG